MEIEHNATAWHDDSSIRICPTCQGKGHVRIDALSLPILSLVIPVFQEAARLENNLTVIVQTVRTLNLPFEMIVVDDGSTDDTWHILRVMRGTLPELVALRLSRNFGKESALAAGIAHARGAACIIMDSDLQHPPSLIPEMVRLWQSDHWDIVEAVKTDRGNESVFYKFAAGLFYSVFKRSTRIDLSGASDFKLLDAKALAGWAHLHETNTFFRGLVPWLGFRRTQISFRVPERVGGKSRWSAYNLIRLAMVGITAFSTLPLQIITILGVLVLMSSALFGIYEILRWVMGFSYPGFPTIILLQLGIGGILMLSLGIIGTYIARIFEEVKGRPRYLVMEKLDSTPTASQSNVSS